MPEWQNTKFQILLTPSIWNRNAEEIKEILQLSQWNEQKFQNLLTPTIWKTKAQEIRKILEMPEWQDKRFENLLTSNIWKNSAKIIKDKLSLKYWQDSRYIHLLVPSIFTISTNNIINGISLLEKYKIGQYITNRALRRNPKELELLIKYMLKHNISLVVDYGDGTKLNTMLNSSNSQLKEKYNIDIKKVIKEMKGLDR